MNKQLKTITLKIKRNFPLKSILVIALFQTFEVLVQQGKMYY